MLMPFTQHSPVCDTVGRSEHPSEGQSTLHEHFEGYKALLSLCLVQHIEGHTSLAFDFELECYLNKGAAKLMFRQFFLNYLQKILFHFK